MFDEPGDLYDGTDSIDARGAGLASAGGFVWAEDEKAQRGFSYWATVPEFREDAIGDFAYEFLEQKGNTPFYLHVPFYAPHTPYDYQPEADRKPFKTPRLGASRMNRSIRIGIMGSETCKITRRRRRATRHR